MCWTVCCSRFIIQAVKWDYHSHDVSLQAVCLLSQKRSDNIPQKQYTCSKHAADVFYVCQQYFTSRTALSIQIRKMERENLHTSSQPNQPAHHRTAEPTTTQSAQHMTDNKDQTNLRASVLLLWVFNPQKSWPEQPLDIQAEYTILTHSQ